MWIRMQSFAVYVLLAASAGGAHAGTQAEQPTAPARAECGGATFEVEIRRGAHPLSNVYQLKGRPASSTQPARVLYTSDIGGWFYAACVPGRRGDLLVFQAFCGGSACIEDKYGAVSPKTLNLLLKPDLKNVSNARKLQPLLRGEVPYLPEDSRAFCCEGDDER